MSIKVEEIINQINQLRTDPKAYGEKLQLYSTYFDDSKILRVPGSNIGIRTTEGRDGYIEAANFLKNEAEAVKPFEENHGLTLIAQEFLDSVVKVDPSEVGDISMDEIINKYGEFNGNFSRAMEFGANTSEQVVINLVVSDGDKTRGQRDSLLNGNLKLIGVATGKHEIYRTCTVIVSCTEFIEI